MLTFDLVVIDLGFNIVRLIFIADNGSAAHHEGCGQHTTSEQERARDESPELCPTMRTITTLLVVDSNHFAVWASSLSLGSAARRQRATQDVRREDAETTYHRSAADGSVADRSVADRSAADRSVADRSAAARPPTRPAWDWMDGRRRRPLPGCVRILTRY